MARPKNQLFYEVPLPDWLPPGKEWLRDYHRNSQAVVEYLVTNGALSSARHGAIRALTRFREYLLSSGQSFSVSAVEKWCQDNALSAKEYRITLNRLQDVYLYGSVQPLHRFPQAIHYSASLKLYWSDCLADFSASLEGSIKDRHRRNTVNAVACFLYKIQGWGIMDISQITFEVLEKYCEQNKNLSHYSDTRYTYKIGDFLRVMAGRGLCSYGLGWYPYFRMKDRVMKLSDFTQDLTARIEAVRKESLHFSADEYACLIPDFLKECQDLGYSKTCMKTSRFALYNLLLFLEMNGLGYHHEIACVWTEYSRMNWQLTGWKQSRRTFSLFDMFLDQNAVLPQVIARYRKLKSESLPEWCRQELDLFISQKQKEGWASSTVCMFRSSITRFCEYIAAEGLSSFSEITPDTIKAFNHRDLHKTVEGKNAYNIRIRKFLKYLERKGLIPYGTHLSLCTKAAFREKIVTVLKEQEQAVLVARGKYAALPLEYRAHACLMLGLHMGFRASDVTGLKLSDINWNRQSIRIIQKKTAREIEVPMPVEVGNAIYLYLKYGRHASDSPYVFIKNRVPYNGVQRGTCNYALKKALPDRIGYSYHSVRRTFATERLRNNTGRQAIADLLGHSDTSSLRHYLLHDEEHMRMCPISMAEAGIIPEGGLYD